MPSRSWRFHAGRILLLALGVAAAGWLFGIPLLALGLGAVVYVVWQVVNLWRLYRWVQNPSGDVPQSYGLWADIYDGISDMEVRDQRQKEKYRTMIDEFRGLTDAFPDATLAIDENDVITWFNRAAERMLELKDPGDLGQPVTNLLRGPDFARWLRVQEEVRSPLEMASPRNERRWLTVSAVRFRGRQRLIVLRDITEVHNLEKIRRDFVANISHELRTPLTVVQGYLELLDAHPSSDVAEAVAKMLHQTGHMQSLLDDLLELSRVQSGELKDDEDLVNVGAVLMQLKEQAEELSRDRHDIVFDVDHELYLTGVSADLESAFGNLISNAIKYTPEGGTITVTWRNSPEGPQFAVDDEGVGIPARDIPRVTERFYRVGSDRGRLTGGTGLGLAIVKHVLNAHQAELAIESALGEGSTFTVTFPAERARVKVDEASNEDFPDS
jgi:two-component system phosphate regulon sensor histidine kinase PhoR